jgi:phage terminase small subunit
LNPRQLRYLEGVLSGKTKKSAALAAGYSESTARNAAAVIERPLVRLALQEVVRDAIPPEKFVQRLVEGLDAMDTVVAKYKGKITDKLAVIAWDTRLRYIELAAKMAGYYVEDEALTVDDLSQGLESRSNQELDYFLSHGCWPEESGKLKVSAADESSS